MRHLSSLAIAALTLCAAAPAHAQRYNDWTDVEGSETCRAIWKEFGHTTHGRPIAVYCEVRDVGTRPSTGSISVDAAEVTANCLHPGVVNTKLGRGAGRLAGLAWTAGRPFMRSPRRGASTIVYLATSEEGGEVTGGYYEDSRPAGTSAAAADIELADRLWRESERLVGLPPSGSG